jgi:integrase
MAKRRGNQEGSIYQAKDGIWFAQLSPDEFGKRPKRRAKSQKEARALLREMQEERKKGVDLTLKQPTIKDFSQIWLDEVIGPFRKSSTYEGYKNVVAAYVLPELGTIQVSKLTSVMVQRWINKLSQQYQPATVRNAYLRLRGMLHVAVRYKLVSYNVAIDAALPKLTTKQIALTIEEAKRFLETVRGERLEVLYVIFLLLGLRRGEGLGLYWSDIDWSEATITIRRQVQSIGGKTIISPTTKTDEERTIPIPRAVLNLLRQHATIQHEEKYLLRDVWQNQDLVFASTVGTAISPRNLQRQFRILADRAGLDLRVHIHTFRHTFATLIGELNTEERVIGELLGHKPKTITARYAKATMQLMREGVEKLAEKMGITP